MFWTQFFFLAKSCVLAHRQHFKPLISWPIGSENLKFHSVTVYPNYEVSIDLNLSENPHTGFSNILAFHQNGVKGLDTSVPGNIPPGARIPAVFLYGKSTKLLICTTTNDFGNNFLVTTNEMPIGKWFNLKIKDSFQKKTLKNTHLFVKTYWSNTNIIMILITTGIFLKFSSMGNIWTLWLMNDREHLKMLMVFWVTLTHRP